MADLMVDGVARPVSAPAAPGIGRGAVAGLYAAALLVPLLLFGAVAWWSWGQRHGRCQPAGAAHHGLAGHSLGPPLIRGLLSASGCPGD
jgi:hypothetical protein